MSDKEIISARISDLNIEQLGQVHSMLKKQQEQLVEQNQQLGQQIDALREQRSGIMGQVNRLASDMNFVALRMEQLRRYSDPFRDAIPDSRMDSTVGDLVRRDGTAPGAVIEASAQ